MSNNVWFIAGASNGFGRAIALEALRRGDKVVAASRSPSKMQDLKDAGALVLRLDISADDESLKAVLKEAIDTYGRITHLINAAGSILEGPLEGASQQEVQAAYAVNVFGPMNLTRLALAYMRPQGSGVIANFGSLGSWVGSAACGYYISTKWAISGYTESLYQEVKPLGLSPIVIEPGYFRTGFLGTGGDSRQFVSNQMVEEYKDTPVPVYKDLLAKFDGHQPGDVVKGAKVIVDVLTQTGYGEGKEVPMRLILGPDVFQTVKQKLTDTEALINEWKEASTSTNHDDVQEAQ